MKQISGSLLCLYNVSPKATNFGINITNTQTGLRARKGERRNTGNRLNGDYPAVHTDLTFSVSWQYLLASVKFLCENHVKISTHLSETAKKKQFIPKNRPTTIHSLNAYILKYLYGFSAVQEHNNTTHNINKDECLTYLV